MPYTGAPPLSVQWEAQASSRSAHQSPQDSTPRNLQDTKTLRFLTLVFWAVVINNLKATVASIYRTVLNSSVLEMEETDSSRMLVKTYENNTVSKPSTL
jgi:hypothetical protein